MDVCNECAVSHLPAGTVPAVIMLTRIGASDVSYARLSFQITLYERTTDRGLILDIYYAQNPASQRRFTCILLLLSSNDRYTRSEQ